MSYSSNSPTSTSDHSTAAVKTALRAALGSLDVQLETELERYRQAALKQKERGDRLNPTVVIPEATIAEATNRTSPTTNDQPVSPLSAASSASPAYEVVDADSPFQLSDLENPDTSVPPTGQAAALNTTALHTATPDGIDPADQTDPTNLADLDGASQSPQTYLASSEALLASDPNPRRRSRRSVSPLSVGVVMILLLASATVGYVLVNPESLDRMGLSALRGRNTSPSDSTATDSASNSTTNETANTPANPGGTSAKAPNQELPTSPNLAKEEFVDIDLNNLSQLKGAPSPTPTPAASPSPTPKPESNLDNLAAQLAPQTAATATPKPSASPSPSAKPSSTLPPLPTFQEDANYTGYYFVVVNDSRPETLAKVKQANPEAYFEQISGAQRIQVGAFDSAGVAQEVVNRLSQQGFPAQVYRP